MIRKCYLGGKHLLLRDFGPYGIIFINACIVNIVAMFTGFRALCLLSMWLVSGCLLLTYCASNGIFYDSVCYLHLLDILDR
jgi:hypothetical protein